MGFWNQLCALCIMSVRFWLGDLHFPRCPACLWLLCGLCGLCAPAAARDAPAAQDQQLGPEEPVSRASKHLPGGISARPATRSSSHPAGEAPHNRGCVTCIRPCKVSGLWCPRGLHLMAAAGSEAVKKPRDSRRGRASLAAHRLKEEAEAHWPCGSGCHGG